MHKENESIKFGSAIKTLRRERDWTLKELHNRTGIPVSTLSKVENGIIQLSFSNVQKLAKGLNVNFSDLMDTSSSSPFTSSKGALRSVTKLNTGLCFDTGVHSFESHASDIHDKQMEPLIARVKARSIDDYEDSSEHRHEGEEFIYVLEGSIRIFTEYYEPTDLDKGESIYLNASMWHATITTSQQDALIMSVCSYGKRKRNNLKQLTNSEFWNNNE